MDMDFLTGASDHTLSDILQLDLPWPNVSSPNSPHMYDHDKLQTLLCMPSGSLVIADEFDLQPQFEHSDNILVSYDGSSKSASFNFPTDSLLEDGNNVSDLSGLRTKYRKDKKDLGDFQEAMSTGDSQLTLSQLNANYEDTNSQKSFANSISSEDLAVMETLFVRPSSVVSQKVKAEVESSCEKQTTVTQWIEQMAAVKAEAIPVSRWVDKADTTKGDTGTVGSRRSIGQWIEKTIAANSEPDDKRIDFKQEVSRHGFSPQLDMPSLLPDRALASNKNTPLTNLLENKRPSSQVPAASPEIVHTQSLVDVKRPNSDLHDRFTEYLLKARDARKRQIDSVPENKSESEKWEEIKQFLKAEPEAGPSLPTGRAKRQRFDSGSSVWTSEYDSSDASLHSDDEGADSDASDDSWKIGDHVKSASGKSQKHAFWQYNLQSKGPKGKRLIEAVTNNDPHVLPEVEDPVFDQTKFKVTLTHGGKARRGDGNDVLPNPKKLFHLGNELKRLMKQIHVFSPMNDMPPNVRSKSRKEKNKIASRVCRLRKKAQHEANKMKRFGLEQEHSRLMEAMGEVKVAMYNRLRGSTTDLAYSLSDEVNQIIDSHLSARIRVAGNTVEYVNNAIDRVAEGDNSGRLK